MAGRAALRRRRLARGWRRSGNQRPTCWIAHERGERMRSRRIFTAAGLRLGIVAFVLPLAAGACQQSGIIVGRPGVQVGIPLRRMAAFGDTVTDRLYFGRGVRDGETVSDSAWAAFLREVVTPRFPDGLTVYRAEGQWREDDGLILREQTF